MSRRRPPEVARRPPRPRPPARRGAAVVSSACFGVLLLLSTCQPDDEHGPAREPDALPERTTFNLLQAPAAHEPTGVKLQPGNQGPWLTWLERDSVDSGVAGVAPDDPAAAHGAHGASAAGGGWSLHASRLEDGVWQPPVRLVGEAERGRAFFANWADVPSLVELEGGLFTRPVLVVQWLEKLGEGPYAYGAQLGARRGDALDPLGLLHDDTSETEHGFVSLVEEGGAAQAFWLDGRAMQQDGPMSLRATRVGRDGATRPSQLLDPRVCECCPTDAAATSQGPIVVYRDRSEDEIRDIWRVRWQGDRWSAPAPVHVDGWRIAGCPVNGPAVAAEGDLVVVAWYTGAGGARRVFAALSDDAGHTFGEPVLIDGERPYGRVDVALAGGVAWVSWLGESIDGAAMLLRPLRPTATEISAEGAPPTSADARLGAIRTVGLSSAARSAGIPRLITLGDGLLAAWLEQEEDGPRHLRTALVSW